MLSPAQKQHLTSLMGFMRLVQSTDLHTAMRHFTCDLRGIDPTEPRYIPKIIALLQRLEDTKFADCGTMQIKNALRSLLDELRVSSNYNYIVGALRERFESSEAVATPSPRKSKMHRPAEAGELPGGQACDFAAIKERLVEPAKYGRELCTISGYKDLYSAEEMAREKAAVAVTLSKELKRSRGSPVLVVQGAALQELETDGIQQLISPRVKVLASSSRLVEEKRK